MNDPYDTAGIRARVLAAWTAAPARFREDANAEEDLARTAYRDRLVVELAQNAADAARRAGVPGRLVVRVVDGVLYAANPGAPLDAAGVEALCHLRASSKDEGIGRYGVGFKAVLAVTDAPAIVSRAGGVSWSRAATASLVAAEPSLAAEVARREGAVPVMRLPYPAVPDAVTAGLLETYDTVVVLPLRVDVRDVLDAADPTLLLTLDGLDEIDVDGRVLRGGGWHAHTAHGVVPADLLADRPVEERERRGWSVTWAVPDDGPWTGDRMLRAPQPTDERVDLPVLLSMSAPLDPSRRHVVPGALLDWVVARAAEAYVGFLESLPPLPDLLDLLPSTLPASAVDLALREAIAAVLPRARVVGPQRLRGEEAAVLDLGPASVAVTEALGLPALVDPSWLRRRAALGQLGVRVLDTADVVDLLGTSTRTPAEWAVVYAALDGVPDRDALRALPVPLADGRLVTGPRGLLLPPSGSEVPAGSSLRWVHPDACAGPAADVLLAAGAVRPDTGALLDALRDAVEQSLDDECDDVAAEVLPLLAVSPGAAVGRRWLGGLALRGEDGDLWAAEELLLPASYGGRLVSWVGADSPFGVVADAVVARYGVDAVLAAGVLRTFAETDDPDGLDDVDGYAYEGDLLALRDLEWVAPNAWGAALSEIATVFPRHLAQPSYTRWWLARHPVVPASGGGLYLPGSVAAPDADEDVRALYPVATADVALPLLRELYDADDLASRLLDVGVSAGLLRRAYDVVAARGLPLPDRVRAIVGGEVRTVPRDEAYVVDRPDLLPLMGERPWVPVAFDLADRLGLRRASDLPVQVTSSPVRTADGYDVHDPLLVDGVPVSWSLAGNRAAVGPGTAGLARLVAWREDRWADRYAIEASLRGDDDAAERLLD